MPHTTRAHTQMEVMDENRRWTTVEMDSGYFYDNTLHGKTSVDVPNPVR